MDPLSEAFEHHIWATEKLIGHLRGLPEAALTSTSSGVYGEVLATLSHLLEADGRYIQYLEGTPPAPKEGSDPTEPIAVLADQLRHQAVRWRILLARVDQLDVTIPARRDRPEMPHATNLLLAQALHHGTDHRTQICTVLTSNGYDAPDLDVWRYWRERGSDQLDQR
jgi:uncharacterized damage-inducible protein DinB